MTSSISPLRYEREPTFPSSEAQKIKDLINKNKELELTIVLNKENIDNIFLYLKEYTILTFSITINKPSLAKLAIENGANVKATDKDGKTAVHIAALYGTDEILSLLLEKNAEVDACDYLKNTPLILAAKHPQSIHCLKMLINHGAHLESVNSDGDTALSLACSCKNPEAVQALVEAGASYKWIKRHYNLNRNIIKAIREGVKNRLEKSRDNRLSRL